MTRYVTSLLLVTAFCGAALAQGPQNVIYQHNSFYNDPNTPGYPFYEVYQPWREVTIYHGVEGQVFEFEAVVEDNGQYVGPGDINRVLASTGAGPVVVTFVGHNGHPYGAANIKELRIDQPSVNGVIETLDISNDLGEYGPIRAAAVGTMTIGGNVLNDIYVPGTIGGPVTIVGYLGADLTCYSLGDLTVLAGGGTVAGGFHHRGWTLRRHDDAEAGSHLPDHRRPTDGGR